jgi:hypothetical protein
MMAENSKIEYVPTNPYPYWAFAMWCKGYGVLYCAADDDLPVGRLRRIWWMIEGNFLRFVFGFWRYR